MAWLAPAYCLCALLSTRPPALLGMHLVTVRLPYVAGPGPLHYVVAPCRIAGCLGFLVVKLSLLLFPTLVRSPCDRHPAPAHTQSPWWLIILVAAGSLVVFWHQNAASHPPALILALSLTHAAPPLLTCPGRQLKNVADRLAGADIAVLCPCCLTCVMVRLGLVMVTAGRPGHRHQDVAVHPSGGHPGVPQGGQGVLRPGGRALPQPPTGTFFFLFLLFCSTFLSSVRVVEPPQ